MPTKTNKKKPQNKNKLLLFTAAVAVVATFIIFHISFFSWTSWEGIVTSIAPNDVIRRNLAPDPEWKRFPNSSLGSVTKGWLVFFSGYVFIISILHSFLT